MMTKEQARAENPDAVMLCVEGVFYSWYEMDALVMNKLFGFKVSSTGRRHKGGTPQSGAKIFERLETANVSYILFKKGEGIIKRFDAEDCKYPELVENIVPFEIEPRTPSNPNQPPKAPIAPPAPDKPETILDVLKSIDATMKKLLEKMS